MLDFWIRNLGWIRSITVKLSLIWIYVKLSNIGNKISVYTQKISYGLWWDYLVQIPQLVLSPENMARLLLIINTQLLCLHHFLTWIDAPGDEYMYVYIPVQYDSQH